jgi:hypothetical protein
VKGYIAQEMGEAVDWAATAKELDRRVGTQRTTGLELKLGASGYNGGCPSTNGDAACSQLTSTEMGVLSRPRLHVASDADVQIVKEFHEFLIDLQKCAQRKIERLADDRKAQAEKIIGLKFNMWDCKSTATEASEAISTAEADLRSLVEALGIQEEEVC